MKTEQTIEQPTAPDGSLDDCFALMIRRAAELQDALCRHDEWRCLQFAMCISKCVIRLAKFMKRADPDAAIGFYYPSLRVFVPEFVGCVRVMAQDATATPTAAHNREDWDAAYALATEGQQIIAALCTLDQAQSWHRSTTCHLCAQPVPRLTKEKRERLGKRRPDTDGPLHREMREDVERERSAMTPQETSELARDVMASLAAPSGSAMGLCPGCGCIQVDGYVGGWYGWICGSQSLSHRGERILFKQSNACASMHWRLRAEKAEARLRVLHPPNSEVRHGGPDELPKPAKEAVALQPVVGRLERHIAQMASHQKERQGGKLLIDALAELKRLHTI